MAVAKGYAISGGGKLLMKLNLGRGISSVRVSFDGGENWQLAEL